MNASDNDASLVVEQHRRAIRDKRRELLRISLTPQLIGETLAFSAAGTLAVFVVGWLQGAVALSVVTMAIAVALAVAQAPILQVVRRTLNEGDYPGYGRAYHVAAQIQFSWLLWLAVIGGPMVMGLSALAITAYLYNDVRMVEQRLVRRAYLMMFPVFDVWAGALWVFTDVLPFGFSWSTALAIFILQVLVAALVDRLVEVIAGQALELEVKVLQQEAMSRRLDRAETERALLFKMSHLLGRGLALSRFWHDARNAVQSVILDGPFIRDIWEDKLDQIEDPEEREDMADALVNLTENANHLGKMLREVKKTLGGAEELRPLSPNDLVDEVMAAVRKDLRLRGLDGPGFEVATQDDVHLWLAPSQVRAIANVVINGAVRSEHGPVEIRGSSVNAELYAIEVKDRGVDGEARALALKRVRARLQLADPHDIEAQARDNVGDGFGMGLMFAKVQVVGRGGEIAVRANQDGPGLTFRILLRRPFGAPEAS